MAETQQTTTTITPAQIIDILIRRRWIILVPLCISLSVGLVFAFILPRTYQANTTILVQPQEVPGSYVKSIVSSGFDARISAISQQVLSRSNLEKIIEQHDLFSDPESEKMYFEDKLTQLRKRIDVHVDRGDTRSGAGAFSVSFKGDSPEKVKQITNSLASFFMDENLKLREAQAIGTSEFIDAELEKTRNRLETLEGNLAAYRTKFLGGLPSELNSNLSSLNRLQQQLTDQQSALREAKNAINLYKMQVAYLNENPSIIPRRPLTVHEGVPAELPASSTDETKLEQSEQALNNLLLTYTDKHPDVVKLKKYIDKLRKKTEQDNKIARIKEKTGSSQEISPDIETEEMAEIGQNTSESGPQQMQLDQLKREVKLITEGIRTTEQKMQTVQKLVADTPKREQELLSLQRDYENIKSTYNSLLDRKLEAELAVSMEKKQKGEQFRILDSARLPEKPISPNVKILFMFAIAGGLGFSGAIIFLLEFVNPPIRQEEIIENVLGLPVIAFIPPLRKANYAMKKRIELTFFFIVSLYAGMIFMIFVVLNLIGVVRTLNFIGIDLTV